MRHSFLMCRPTFFAVNYNINPWMTDNIGKVDHDKAVAQWEALYQLIATYADVELVDPVEGLPDMVFTANAAYLHKGTAWISSFKNEERKGEEKHFKKWFDDHDFETIYIADPRFVFEGAGDCLDDSHGETWIGYGQRSYQESIHMITRQFDDHVWHKLYMKTGHFYHLDTCFCPLSKGHIIWYPKAFDTASELLIDLIRGGRASAGVHSFDNQMHIDYSCHLIEVNDEDAKQFACNAVCIDEHIICNLISDELVQKLTSCGYVVHQTDMSEFLKAGGSTKCLTLQLR